VKLNKDYDKLRVHPLIVALEPQICLPKMDGLAHRTTRDIMGNPDLTLFLLIDCFIPLERG